MGRSRDQQAMLEAEEAILLVISRLEQMRALRDDETDILAAIIRKRKRRDYATARRQGKARALFEWTKKTNAELLACRTLNERKAFSAKYRVSLGAMTLQRYRLACNGSGGHDGGV